VSQQRECQLCRQDRGGGFVVVFVVVGSGIGIDQIPAKSHKSAVKFKTVYNCPMQLAWSGKIKGYRLVKITKTLKGNYYDILEALRASGHVFILPITVGGRLSKHYMIFGIADCLFYPAA
jgi:hypothetical protein